MVLVETFSYKGQTVEIWVQTTLGRKLYSYVVALPGGVLSGNPRLSKEQAKRDAREAIDDL